MPQLTPAQFVAKWKPVVLSERAASHEHFIDLCRLLGQPTPAEHDATGAEYTFEKGVTPTGGASTLSTGTSLRTEGRGLRCSRNAYRGLGHSMMSHPRRP